MDETVLDLSCFPLLRIDQIHKHSTETLEESRNQLVVLQASDDGSSIKPFVAKLLVHIRKELSDRCITNGRTSKPELYQFTPKKNSRTKHAGWSGNHRCTELKSSNKAQPMLSFFVPNTPESSSTSFRARSKQVKASLQARSQGAGNRKHEEMHKERARKLEEWRSGREQSRKRREELLDEERKAARIRRRERSQREERVKESMQTAAANAKSLALQSGFTPEEAILEAAAAAAKVVDDQSTVFNESDGGDCDVDSFVVDVDGDDDSASGGAETSDEHNIEDDESNHEAVAVEGESPDSTGFDNKADEATDTDLQTASEESNNDETDDGTDDQIEETPADHTTHTIDGSTEESSESFPIVKTTLDDMAGPEIIEGTLVDMCNGGEYPEVPASPIEYLAEQMSESPKSSYKPDADSHSTVNRHTAPSDTTSQNDTDSCQTSHTGKFTAIFPSFGQIFSQFAANKRADDKELTMCMHAVIERCANIDMLIDDPDYIIDEPELFYRIKSNRPEVVSTVSKCFSDRRMSRWEEGSDDALLNLLWTWGMPKAADFEHLLVFQKISRFRHTRGLTRKDLLKKNIQRCMGISDKATKDGFNIMPLTYALPHEYNAFVKGFASVNKAGKNRTNYWIIKPIGLSRGRGISLVDNVSGVSYSQPIVVQKYIDDPLCFMGYKFDLRVYVLVTSFSPHEAFIYKEGLARFGSRKYSSSPESLHDLRIHLTNSSIQKEFGSDIDKCHPAYLAGSSGAESKVAITWLFDRLDERGIDSELLWKRIVDVCTKALVAGGADIPYQPNSFELFGFDLMFDQTLKCWLIEVNSSPSLSCDTPLDTRIKGDLIRDTILLVDPLPINQDALADVCNRRLSSRKEASNKSLQQILEEDLRNILNNRLPRAFGEMPRRLGRFYRIFPVEEGVK